MTKTVDHIINSYFSCGADEILQNENVTNTFVYSFTVDAYMLAVLLSALAVYLTRKYRFGFLAGALLLGISIGIYQAYFSYVIVLFLLLFIMDLIDNEDFKQEFVVSWTMRYCGITGSFVCVGSYDKDVTNG